MCKILAAVACALMFFSTSATLAQSIDETADSLETAIGDLQSALDELEMYRGSAEDDLAAALRSVRNARREMRATAISLLLSSVDPRRPKELQRTLDALRILEPKAFDKPKAPGSTPHVNPAPRVPQH